MEKIIDLESFIDGAFTEQVNAGVNEVLQNINDVNTDWKKKRKLTIDLVFTSREDRELMSVDVSRCQCKT